MNFFSGFVAHVCICIGLLDLSVQLPNTYLHKHLLLYHNIFLDIFSKEQHFSWHIYNFLWHKYWKILYYDQCNLYHYSVYSTILENVWLF